MPLESLYLHNYRNYERLDIRLSERVNLVVGPNAQGKTNLLEAVSLLSTGRVLRGSRDAEAIRQGEARAEVIGQLAETGTELKITLEAGARKKAFLNGASLPRSSDLLGRLPSVIFSNDDLAIVREDASSRRLFLDSELSQLFPAYFRHFAAYKRALEQRNALLRLSDHQVVPDALYEPWEAQLAEHGEAIRRYRAQFVMDLAEVGSPIQAELAKGEELELAYEVKEEGPLAESLQGQRGHDQRRGTTTVGPHRDDFLIEVGGREARRFGSQGQQRTCAIALKLATLRVLHRTLDDPAVVLLDDVLSELDAFRREKLLEWVDEAGCQTVLTCTEPDQAGERIAKSAAIFQVLAGTVREL